MIARAYCRFAILLPFAALACLQICGATPLAAQELPEPVAKWFTALRSVDRIGFGELMHNDATVELKSPGFTQTKGEFIEALDNWQEIAGDIEITARPVSVTDASASVQVCYRRPSEAWTNLEVYTFADGFITGSVQERISEDCAGFD